MSLKYRCLFLDLDGTLIKQDGSIPPNTLDCLNELRKKGMRVSVATGRSYASAYNFLNALKISDDSVFANGAIVRKPNDENFDLISSINSKEALKIIYLLKKFDVPFGLQTLTGGNFVSDPKKWPNKSESYRLIEGQNFDALTIIKIFFLCYDHQEQSLVNHINKNGNILASYNLFRSSTWLLELMPVGVNKANAARFVLDRWKIDQEAAIAVGDQQNDYEIIRDLGFGVSVEDGCSKNHKVSKLTIPSPEKDGIEFLTDYIIKKLPI